MLAPALIFAIGAALLAFSLQIFLNSDRRKFANEMIKAATMGVMGIFILYFWSTIATPSAGGYNTRGGGY